MPSAFEQRRPVDDDVDGRLGVGPVNEEALGFTASGHPAMQIPLGLGKEGLPLEIQIVGPYWSEPELIAFARHVVKLTDGFVKPAGY